MKIMLGHFDFSVAGKILNRLNIHTHGLQMADIGMPAAMGCQLSYTFNLFQCRFKGSSEPTRIDGFICFGAAPEVSIDLQCQQHYNILPDGFGHRDIPNTAKLPIGIKPPRLLSGRAANYRSIIILHTASSPCREQSGIGKLAGVARFSKEMSWRTATLDHCVGKYLVDCGKL